MNRKILLERLKGFPIMSPQSFDSQQSIELGGEEHRRIYLGHSDQDALAVMQVELWIELPQSNVFHVPLARGNKTTGHWEFYTTPGEGAFNVYAPDLQPSDSSTKRVVVDSGPHVLGWSYDGKTQRFSIDGALVVEIASTGKLQAAKGMDLVIGGIPDGSINAEGLFYALKISNALRPATVDSIVTDLQTLFEIDEHTVGLWRASDIDNGVIPDATGSERKAIILDASTEYEFPQMLDDVESEEQLALTLSGDPKLDTFINAPHFELEAKSISKEIHSQGRSILTLDGEWFLWGAEPGEGIKQKFQSPDFDRANWLKVTVPTTVQAALVQLGKLADPLFGKRSDYPEEKQEWWFVREFTLDEFHELSNDFRLYFDGVDYAARFFLNGTELGVHAGMFGGPEFYISELLKNDTKNVLAVVIAPPPSTWVGRPKPSVVFGWHYGHMISMGIWRHVEIQRVPEIELLNPQVITHSLDGTIKVGVDVQLRRPDSLKTPILISIAPKNFSGDIQHFSLDVEFNPGVQTLSTILKLRNPKVWEPMGYGKQNLYTLTISIPKSEGNFDNLQDTVHSDFGLRTLEMRSAKGAWPGSYRWQFVINGREMFLKGANWCFIDPYMKPFDARYQHTLNLIYNAGIQLLRVWGGGPIESDAFYDFCNEHGILIWQEFPYCFEVPDIPATDPLTLDDQAARVVRRLRNHPCLILWGGGNEVQPNQPKNNALKLLGKRIRQLDPSRPYHITSPWGSDIHNWAIFHSGEPIEHYRKTPTVFLSEYGLPSAMAMESMRKCIATEELDHWPPTEHDVGVIAHSQQFSLGDFGKMLTYAGDYGPVQSWDDYRIYTQMAQADAFRYGAEMERARAKLGATGFCFYKATDIFPGQAWSIIDYYGVPKLSYDRVTQFIKPIAIFATHEKFAYVIGETLKAHIYIANDTPSSLKGLAARITLFGPDGSVLLDRISEDHFVSADGIIEIDPVEYVIQQDAPLLLCLTLSGQASILHESWYWFNYASITDSVKWARSLPHWGYPDDQMNRVFSVYKNLPPSRLRNYPQTELQATDWKKLSENSYELQVQNAGNVPAFTVTIYDIPQELGVILHDNAFCLRPGDTKTVRLTLPPTLSFPSIRIHAWNTPEIVVGNGIASVLPNTAEMK